MKPMNSHGTWKWMEKIGIFRSKRTKIYRRNSLPSIKCTFAIKPLGVGRKAKNIVKTCVLLINVYHSLQLFV